MNRPITTEEQNSLEKLVDHTSIAEVLQALSEICYLKSQHIEENWQDHSMARRWERAGNKLSVDAIKNIITSLP